MSKMSAPWWRIFDRDYWMMRSALGYPVPHRVEALWPKSLNTGNNFKCGKCEAMRLFPGVNIAAAIFQAHDYNSPTQWADVEHRVLLALKDVGAEQP